MTPCTSQILQLTKTNACIAAVMLTGVVAAWAAAGGCDDFEAVASPSPGSRGNFLYGVAAVAPDDVWAVGLYRVAGVPSITSDTLPLAMHWNGIAWSAVSLPSLPAPANGPDVYLHGVAAFASDDVWAVGGAKPSDDLQRPQTLVFHYDGMNWQRIASPVANPNDGGSYFIDVAGVSSNDLWAVGNVNGQFLAAHWDGSSWQQTPVPPGALEDQELRAISVIASNDVWAVGGTGEGAAQPIVVHWNGSLWGTPIPHPPQSQYNGLWDVQAFAMNDIWVTANTAASPPQQVFLHWNGSSWTSYPAPQYHSARYVGTANDLFSVGYNEVMHWDGSSWSLVATLNPNAPLGGFEDAVQLSDGTIWAVGRSEAGELASTLAAHFMPCTNAPAGDTNGDDVVNITDLLAVINAWGACDSPPAGCPADVAPAPNGDGVVDVTDLLLIINNWS